MKTYLYLALALICLVPAAFTPWLVDLQIQVWMFACDIFKPNPIGLVVSFYYWPVLLVLTAWYWIWRFMRWIFEDEGPLPRFRTLLFIMWAPVYAIPIIVVASTLAWMICLYKAMDAHNGK